MEKMITIATAFLMFLTPLGMASGAEDNDMVFELDEEINGVAIEAKAVDGVDVDTCTAKIQDDMGGKLEFKIVKDRVNPQNDKFEAKSVGDTTPLLDGTLRALEFCLESHIGL